MTFTPVQVPELPQTPIDIRAIREVLENAREGLPLDFAWAAATTASLCGLVALVGPLGLALLISPVVLSNTTLRLAIARRRRLCLARGLDVAQVDRLCRRVNIFEHVMQWNALSEAEREALVVDILRGRYALNPPLPPTK